MRTARPHVVEMVRNRTREYYIEERIKGHRQRFKVGSCSCRNKDCEHRLQAEKRLAETVAGDSPTISLASAIADYKATLPGRIAASTIKSYRISLNQFEEYCRREGVKDLSRISAATVLAFKTRYSRDRAANTVNHTMRAIATFFAFCVALGHLDESPVEGIKKMLYAPGRKKENVLTTAEHEKLCSVLCEVWLDIYLVLWGTGIRVGELSALRVQDCDFTRNLLHVRCRADWQSKTKSNRSIPIDERIAPGTIAALQRLISGRRAGRLLPEHLNVNRVIQILPKLFARHGIKGTNPDADRLTAHSMRHTYCTRLLNELRMPLPLVAACTGHKTFAMLARYNHTQAENVAAFVASL